MLRATTENPEEALSGGARALKVAQATLGPAAGDVAADGVDGLDAFEGSYGTQALIDGLVGSADVPGVVDAAAPHAKKGSGGGKSSSSGSKSSSSGSSSSGSSGGGAADVASFAAKKEGASRRLLAFA